MGFSNFWFSIFIQTVIFLGATTIPYHRKQFFIKNSQKLARKPKHRFQKTSCYNEAKHGHGVPIQQHDKCQNVPGHGARNQQPNIGHGVPNQPHDKCETVPGHGDPHWRDCGQGVQTYGHGAPNRSNDRRVQGRTQHLWRSIRELFSQKSLPTKCRMARATKALGWLRANFPRRDAHWIQILWKYLWDIAHKGGSTVLSTVTKQFPMVGSQHQQPSGSEDYPRRGHGRLPFTSQAVPTTLCPDTKRNFNGLANNPRVLGSAGNKRNPALEGKTFDSLVCHRKGGKTPPNHRLQGNKPISSTKTIQTGKLGRNIPLLKKRHVGSENRRETCLFSFGVCRTAETLCVHPSGGQSVPISSSMLWPKRPPTNLAKCHEGFPQKVASPRHPMLDLLGRHPPGRPIPQGGSKPPANHAPRFGGCGHGDKYEKVTIGTNTGGGPFGVFNKFQKKEFCKCPNKS